MRKAFMIASMTAFAAVAAFAAPRDVTIPQVPTTTEEVAGTPDDRGAVTNFTKPVDEKAQGCGCGKGKPKKAKR